MAGFATVCREWQVLFETSLFRRLVLSPDSLDMFDAVIRRHDIRLGYIRKLWLHIRLSKHECPFYGHELASKKTYTGHAIPSNPSGVLC
jgi:hypothetical protein